MMRATLTMLAALAVGCGEAPDLSDDPVRFVEDGYYRRAVLERDLVSFDNDYAQARLRRYGPGRAWDGLPASDPATGPVTDDVIAALQAGRDPWAVAEATALVPEDLPETREDWAALGERALFDYPMFPDADATEAAMRGLLSRVGFRQAGDTWIGVRLMDTPAGPELAVTCAVCHATVDDEGRSTAVRANRDFDVGRLRLVSMLDANGDLPPDVALGDAAKWIELGPGRSDVLHDDEANPYAFPDFGGIVDMPYLHHTANWVHTGVATLAIRVETVFMGRDTLTPVTEVELGRVPRVLAWAVAEYLRSLPPPAGLPSEGPVARGREVFETAGCPSCHAPPTYTSTELIEVERVGTDAAAGLSRSRFTGYYRIPSLRGVGTAGPLLHDGSIPSLEAMFDSQREQGGHVWGLGLPAEDRDALLAFLRTL